MKMPIFLVLALIKWVNGLCWQAVPKWIRSFGTKISLDRVKMAEPLNSQDVWFMHMFWDPEYQDVQKQLIPKVGIVVEVCPVKLQTITQSNSDDEIWKSLSKRLTRPGHITINADVGVDVFEYIRSERKAYLDMAKHDVSIQHILVNFKGIVVVDNVLQHIQDNRGYDLDDFVSDLQMRSDVQLILIMPDHPRLADFKIPGPALKVFTRPVYNEDYVREYLLSIKTTANEQGRLDFRRSFHAYYSFASRHPILRSDSEKEIIQRACKTNSAYFIDGPARYPTRNLKSLISYHKK